MTSIWIDSNWLVLLSPNWNPNSACLQTESFLTDCMCVSLKEIVEEVKKELHKVKDEIIKGEVLVSLFFLGVLY